MPRTFPLSPRQNGITNQIWYQPVVGAEVPRCGSLNCGSGVADSNGSYATVRCRPVRKSVAGRFWMSFQVASRSVGDKHGSPIEWRAGISNQNHDIPQNTTSSFFDQLCRTIKLIARPRTDFDLGLQ